jgi:para-aminobenzoate synthetase / 4-amino-4-deoxychorismate lyase
MDGNNVVMVQQADGGWLAFEKPVDIVRTDEADKVRMCLARIDEAVDKGLFAAGSIAYEAASGFDKALRTHKLTGIPLLWFGLYRDAKELRDLPAADRRFEVGTWKMSISEPEYQSAIERIKRYIHAGDTYQVNYTTRLRAPFSGDPYALFVSLCRAQRARNCAFVSFDRHSICSASPELFFELDGNRVASRPMKGTIQRGLTYEADLANAKALAESAKNRAENVMIVDMIRNDLGRVADAGSVRVSNAYEIERYPTVYQMTSTVEARTKASVGDIMAALFPCASVTGAPKVRTMEIISELEKEPRGVYCGAIGYAAPGRKARFNVAIRTVVVDCEAGRAEYGVGGGIVWESEAADEYKECLAKASVLTAELPEFELLETMLWTPEEGYFLLDKHLERLKQSAEYFDFVFREDDVAEKLLQRPTTVNSRVRLLLSRNGTITVESSSLADIAQKPFKVGFAVEPVNSQNVFLYHKTTNRGVYEAAKRSHPDCDDVILFNERGAITESTIANVVVQIGSRKITPPISCGLLAGTFREYLFERGEIEEGIVTLDTLRSADKVFLINSVRKWIDARLI